MQITTENLLFYKTSEENTEYYCPVGENIKVTELRTNKNYEKIRWNTFDQYKKRVSTLWTGQLRCQVI